MSESNRVIPESRRPDGTIRKARRVRAGYMPPDEQQKYATPAQRRLQPTRSGPAEKSKQTATVKAIDMRKETINTKDAVAVDATKGPANTTETKGPDDATEAKEKSKKYVPPFARKRMEQQSKETRSKDNADTLSSQLNMLSISPGNTP